VCVYRCAQLSYTTAQNSSDIFRLQTIIIPQMMSTGGEGGVAPGLQINYGTTICHATSKERENDWNYNCECIVEYTTETYRDQCG